VLYGGQIVEMAPVQELFARPMHPYTRALLKTVPRLKGVRAPKLEVIEGQPPIIRAEPSACAFRARCSVAMPRCGQENPLRLTVAAGHDVACFWDATTGEARHV
jgi:peptide/nickel transport system ATP-binding protein/oligopeptide transport system ATP-binding protein